MYVETNLEYTLTYSIVRKVLSLPENYLLSPNLEPDQIPGWDSMGWIGIIAEFEDTQSVSFPIERIDEIKNLKDLNNFFQMALSN